MFIKHLKAFNNPIEKYTYNAVLKSKALLQTTDFGKINAIIRWIILNTKYYVQINYNEIDKNGFKWVGTTTIDQTELFCSMCKLCSIKADEIFCMGDNLIIVEIDKYWYELDIHYCDYFPDKAKNQQYDYSFYRLKKKADMYVPIYGYQFVKIDNLISGNATTLCRSIRKAGFTKENGYSIWDINDMFLINYW